MKVVLVWNYFETAFHDLICFLYNNIMMLFSILYFSVFVCMYTSICIDVLTEQPYLWSVHTWTIVAIPVHSRWVSNYIVGLCNALISSTCLIAVTVAGGPHAMTQPLVKKFSGERVNYAHHISEGTTVWLHETDISPWCSMKIRVMLLTSVTHFYTFKAPRLNLLCGADVVSAFILFQLKRLEPHEPYSKHKF